MNTVFSFEIHQLHEQCDPESDFKQMSTFLSQGPLSLLPSMDNSSVKAAMVSYTDRFY